ncbi:hypothetical protein HAX54_045373 [Datura stramonium]|uniref:Uncharacterized protein n=1 Tax=Datura stramonium TaxID=4076 RepID=A0ABS8SRZ3_DATST|nr:hypothetical protein [Datura stramonium]
MNDAELEEMWKIQRDALDKEESKDPVKDDDDDEQPNTERDKTSGGQDILSNEGQESVLANQLDMNSPVNIPDEGPGTSFVSKVLTRAERQALMKQQKEVERLTALLAQRDAEIANLKAAQTEGPGPMQALRQENGELKAKVNELTQKLLYAYEAVDVRMSLLLQNLSGPSCP